MTSRQRPSGGGRGGRSGFLLSLGRAGGLWFGAFFAGADAEEFESLADEAADEAAVLADASGEDEEVESAEFGGVGSDEFADRGGEDVDGEGGVLVPDSMAAWRRRMSDSPPERAARPDWRLRRVSRASASRRLLRMRKMRTPGSRSPVRVDMGMPPVGVSPHAGVDGAAVEDSGEAGSVAEMARRRRAREFASRRWRTDS